MFGALFCFCVLGHDLWNKNNLCGEPIEFISVLSTTMNILKVILPRASKKDVTFIHTQDVANNLILVRIANG